MPFYLQGRGVWSLHTLAESEHLKIKIGKKYAMDRKQHPRHSCAKAASGVYGLNSVMVALCTPPSKSVGGQVIINNNPADIEDRLPDRSFHRGE